MCFPVDRKTDSVEDSTGGTADADATLNFKMGDEHILICGKSYRQERTFVHATNCDTPEKLPIRIGNPQQRLLPHRHEKTQQ